jgi:hypothetical protein
MPDLLQRSSEWLEAMRVRHVSRPVLFKRGEDRVAVFATIGKTVFQIDEGTGIATQFESRDFLISAVELVIGGKIVLPERGDRIEEMQEEKTFEYEVLAPGKEPCFRYSDLYRNTLRIHTKQIS